MNNEQIQKTLRSFGIALAGFALAWLSTNVIPQIDQTNTGGMIAVALFGVLVDLLRRTWGIGVTPEPVPQPVIHDTTHTQE